MSKHNIERPKLNEIPQARLGMWILIAGEFVIFGGLIVAYLLYRFRYPEWAEMASHTNVWLGSVNTFVLLTSSFFVVKAHEGAVKKDTKKIMLYISLTIVCALIFLVVKSTEYVQKIHHGFTFSGDELVKQGESIESTYWGFYFLMTGLHAFHVIVGATVLFIVMMGARKGKNTHRIEVAGLYWHMVDLIWIFLFPLLYIAD
ncbi:MAG: cytochrome c oxidase subunit 3 [Saprospiraceae bacterium]